ncbi:MAG TPA: WD40 repeat domain-containing protein [Bacillota bacterium]|nr:WD40 repeat domain-containing protein [Bacillota bacterium]
MLKKLVLSLAIIGCLAVSAVAKGEFEGRVFTETPRMVIEKAWLPGTLKISPNGANIGMIVQDESGKSVVVNGIRQKKYEDILDDTIYFTPDSQHILYIAKRNAQFFLVYDGVEHTPYPEIKKKSLVFSPDGAHFAYVAKTGDQWRVVQDKTEHPLYDDINVMTLKFSPDGKRLVYAAQQNEAWFLVEDGRPGKSYDGIRNVVFSPDGQRLAVLVRDGSQFLVVVNEKETSKYEFIRPNSLCFSPDSSRLGFIAQTGDYQYAVIDDIESKKYLKVGNQGIVFSQTGHRYGYTALTEKGWVVVVDGKETGPYDAVLEHSPVFSPNGERVAYAAKVGNHWIVFVDGKHSEKYEAVGEGTIIFSPDSRKFAYVARKSGKWMVPVNHVSGRLYDAIGRDSLAFNNRGDVVYSACRGKQWFVVFNGSEGRAYDQIITGYGGRILGDAGFGYQAVAGTTVYYIAERLPNRILGDSREITISSSALQRGQIYRFTFNPPNGKRLRQIERQTVTVSAVNESMKVLEREVIWDTSFTKNQNNYLVKQQFVSVREFLRGEEVDRRQFNRQLQNTEIRYFTDSTGRLRDFEIQGDFEILMKDFQGATLTPAQIKQMFYQQWENRMKRFSGKTFKIGDSWDFGRVTWHLPNGKNVILQIRMVATDEVRVSGAQCVKLDYDIDFDSYEVQRFINDELAKMDALGSSFKVKSFTILGYELIDPSTMLSYGSKVIFTVKLALDLPNVGQQEALMIMEYEQQVNPLN